MTDHVAQRLRFTPEQHQRGVKSNVLRGLAALTEMLELIGREGATDDVARLLVENELELRELRWFAFQRLTSGGEQK